MTIYFGMFVLTLQVFCGPYLYLNAFVEDMKISFNKIDDKINGIQIYNNYSPVILIKLITFHANIIK